MQVYSINCYDISGGAARAAYRIHQALRLNDIDSRMLVNHASGGDWTVHSPKSYLSKFIPKIRHISGALATKSLQTENPVLHSPAFLPSKWPKFINNSDVDIAHLHWINHEMLSVSDISKIKKPLVWTLHDMWAFCGAEHYANDDRWLNGYSKKNRPSHEKGFDLNQWVWKRKVEHWKQPIHIVAPSNWLAKCARESIIMRDWPIDVIHNAIDTDKWKPIEKKIARQLLKLPLDAPLLMFGALGGVVDLRKGFDLLEKALNLLQGKVSGLELVIFGQLAPEVSKKLGFRVHYAGHLHDDISLNLLYSAVDVLVIPSRQDNLPNTGVESLACGTPVVAFDTGGLPDLVNHQHTGYLAKAFDIDDLARGIEWTLMEVFKGNDLSHYARLDAVSRFSYPVIAKKYREVYETAIKNKSFNKWA